MHTSRQVCGTPHVHSGARKKELTDGAGGSGGHVAAASEATCRRTGWNTDIVICFRAGVDYIGLLGVDVITLGKRFQPV